MPNWRICTRKIKAVLRLHFEGDLSQRAIAKSLGISKEAVREYIKRFIAAKIAWPLPENLSDAELESRLFPVDPNALRKAEPNWALVHGEMKQKGATLAILHQEHLEQHQDGIGYSRFCEQYRKYTLSLKRYMRQTYPAGERAFVDYVGPTISIANIQTGEVRTAQIFVAVLGASNYIYARANWSQSLPNWIDAHIKFFEHIGAVPKVIVCDNLKSAVTKASRTEPIINSTYQNMAEHYDTAILPARAYRPKDKAKAENGVLIVERWVMFVLRKRLFTSLGELNVAISELLEEINRRPFQKQDGNRKQLLETIDRPAMIPLPTHPYEYVEFHKLRVGLDYHIQLNGSRYSVPHTLTRKVIEAQLTVRTVEILYQGRRVASHVRQDHGIITDVAHMPSEHRYLAQWNDGLALDWARTIGIGTEQFLGKLLVEKRTREQGWRAHHALKKVSEEYGALRLEGACKIALESGVRSVSRLRIILANQMDRNPLATAEQETFRKLHEMKLLGISQGLEEQLQNPTSQDLAFEERIGLLVDHEHTYREARRLKRLLVKAKLRENACLENMDYRTNRGLDKSLIASLAVGTWIEQGANLIITGPTGGGKTWIACALGNQMCRQGKSVIFQRLSLLLEEFGMSYADGTFRQRLAQLAKVDLLILDDLGISTLSPTNRSDLLEVIEQRTGRGSTLITSQMPVEK